MNKYITKVKEHCVVHLKSKIWDKINRIVWAA